MTETRQGALLLLDTATGRVWMAHMERDQKGKVTRRWVEEVLPVDGKRR
jgi:hypothetical protein